ncbi:P-loop containing nucleoside triphosphate hydrolase protein [Annulohypoxylon truncatum]|uniref:P-loop containing nucleoside triphosphate hydrolase protein n=1 Tax=Annulohypoxylon truncatum TaxID=327061 RepID=UPI00200874F5|nr:P-loop containing nucleoside triphosphate hydrolase protein [Annulohypoxylon truncatum]KAI1211292.1 P-loop containing nucleoside triphosphate hydrolase protein [Annulohypoxylon truncatum]
MAFLRQTWTLTAKNLKIVVQRHYLATLIRAFVLPILLAAFLTFARNLFVPPAVYGIGDPHAVRSLQDGLAAAASTDRNTVAFVNNGLAGGDIDRVIDTLSDTVTGAGKNASRLSQISELSYACRSSLRGVSPCYGAVVFYSSPREGEGGIWNYTLRADGALGSKIDTTRDDNSGEVYSLPLQRAVDAAISGLSDTDGTVRLPATTEEYPFTPETQEERAARIRRNYQSSLTNFLAVSFFIVVIGICYHMTGHMATEREIGMSQLLDAMMPTKYRWQAQVARLLSYHIAFTVVYLPGWVIGSIIIARGVWANTSVAIVLIYFILAGLALASLSILGAAFFKRSQLSGVVTVIAYILLAILAQTLTSPSTATVTALSLLFTPCNFVWFMTFIARWERYSFPADLVHTPPENPWNLPGIVFWVFLILQIIIYPIIGAYLERVFHGTTTKGRTILQGQTSDTAPPDAVRLEQFTKIYYPNPLYRLLPFSSTPREPVVAVDKLTLTARRGQILALLGANGSGKSTTLDSIAGISKLTSGDITIDGTGGLGIAPQKNVMWDELTVEEHIRVFNRLKSPRNTASTKEIRDLVESVDLGPKVKAMSKTLSGGQKRKLQLGMMLTGGSAVCCVDEVSSGIDPLSRRKIWDILLAERGRRTIILTTHFLDEADLLADHIAILSKGTLRAQGSSVELKDRLGAGYRVHVFNAREIKNPPEIENVTRKIGFDVISYIAPSSSLAADVIRSLEAAGIHDYKFSNPTIEDVFLQVAEEVKGENGVMSPQTPSSTEGGNDKQVNSEEVGASELEKDGLELLSGQPIGFMRQIVVLFMKRCTIFKTNWFPYVAAFLIPIIAAALTSLYVTDQHPVGCNPASQSSADTSDTSNLYDNLFLVAGPSSQFNNATLERLFAPTLRGVSLQNQSQIQDLTGSNNATDPGSAAVAALFESLHLVNSLDEFNTFVEQRRKDVKPAGWWLGDSNSLPTITYEADAGDVYTSVFGQNALDIMLANTSIAANYAPFDTPWAPSTGDSLQLLIYFCLALAAYPAFFGLYPNIERRRNVRGLQYSNGVRSLPLWVSYTAFDFAIVLVSSALVVAAFAASSDVWYHVDYLFLIFILYGLASILFSYVISLFCGNQLSTYAFSAAGQAVGFLIYLIAYLCVITYSPVQSIDSSILVAHFVISTFVPIGSIVRTMFITLNLFSVTCDGDQIQPRPGALTAYGGPILYLALQSAFLFGFLLWHDSGSGNSLLSRLNKKPTPSSDDQAHTDEEVANELVRVTSSPQGSDGLRVLHLTKSFGKNTAVDNVTFGVQHSEVFALLGPNGAGKSTTISLIRGDIQPSRNGGDVFVENTSVSRRRAEARAHLGVCPQFDAIDSMTVLEHLRFYARIRGIPDIEHNVRAVLRAVGLSAFATRMAHALSGGNKRKLSLGIALMGNPSVVLLDEPSSGLDAAAKRVMWRTLHSIVPGRSILLTTHSMEEADALANRAGIIAKRMLAMGGTEDLRRRFGDALHVHLVSRTAPHSTDDEMQRIREWVLGRWPDAQVEAKTYHGQMRFSVPAAVVAGVEGGAEGGGEHGVEDAENGGTSASSSGSAVGQLIVILEEHKEELGIEHYSCTPTTLDQVFLTIVGRHNVQEEGYNEKKKRSWWSWR